MRLWNKIWGIPEESSTLPLVVNLPMVKKILKVRQKGRGVLYLKVNNYTYFRLPERSELNKQLKLKAGDEVCLTIDKI